MGFSELKSPVRPLAKSSTRRAVGVPDRGGARLIAVDRPHLALPALWMVSLWPAWASGRRGPVMAIRAKLPVYIGKPAPADSGNAPGTSDTSRNTTGGAKATGQLSFLYVRISPREAHLNEIRNRGAGSNCISDVYRG